MKEIRRFISVLGIEILLFMKQYAFKFMSGITRCLTKVGAKLLPDLVTFSIFCANILLGFHELIRVMPLNLYMYFLHIYVYFSWYRY